MTLTPSRLHVPFSCWHTPQLWALAWHAQGTLKWHLCTQGQLLPRWTWAALPGGTHSSLRALTPTFVKLLSEQCSTRAAEAESQLQATKTKPSSRITQAVPAAPLVLHPSFLNTLHSATHTSHLRLKHFFSVQPSCQASLIFYYQFLLFGLLFPWYDWLPPSCLWHQQRWSGETRAAETSFSPHHTHCPALTAPSFLDLESGRTATASKWDGDKWHYLLNSV